MQSTAATVEEYLASLPEDRRAAVSAVRKVIRENLDADIEERMNYGMIGYVVPHRVYPAGYHCDPRQPLAFAALASQKGYMSLYLMSVYCGCGLDTPADLHAQWFRERWARSGKKLDMGKSCIRFKRLDDVPLDVVGEAVKRVSARTFIEYYEAGRAAAAVEKAASAGKKAAKKPARVAR